MNNSTVSRALVRVDDAVIKRRRLKADLLTRPSPPSRRIIPIRGATSAAVSAAGACRDLFRLHAAFRFFRLGCFVDVVEVIK
jgi:hypothetical protein